MLRIIAGTQSLPIVVAGLEHAIAMMHHGYACWWSHRAAAGTHLHYRCTFR